MFKRYLDGLPSDHFLVRWLLKRLELHKCVVAISFEAEKFLAHSILQDSPVIVLKWKECQYQRQGLKAMFPKRVLIQG
jgi:hypothetical protein